MPMTNTNPLPTGAPPPMGVPPGGRVGFPLTAGGSPEKADGLINYPREIRVNNNIFFRSVILVRINIFIWKYIISQWLLFYPKSL